jgi:hypothetical protein
MAADYDVLGLAGGIYGLAFADEQFDPTSGDLELLANLAGLAQRLSCYQINNDSGFAWDADNLTLGNESIQETAYAILALNEFTKSTLPFYRFDIQNAANYIMSVQLGTGGWENGSWEPGENNEITGEALWAIATAYPSSNGSWPYCFIATAAYGTPMADELDTLRDLRDEYLLTNPVGEALVETYYSVSPPIADSIAQQSTLRAVVRTSLTPAVAVSLVIVSTTLIQKMVIVTLLALLSVTLARLVMLHRQRVAEIA